MPSTRCDAPGPGRRAASPGPETRPERDTAGIRASGDRAEALIDELGSLADPTARARAEELVRVLTGLYGAGLERIMSIVVDGGAAEVLHRLAADEVVSGLLVLHDLHPLDTGERVRAALAGLRDQGAAVELLDVRDGVVRLRGEGTGSGGASSRATVTEAIERAVLQAAPEVARVEVEEAPAPLLQIRPCPAAREAAP